MIYLSALKYWRGRGEDPYKIHQRLWKAFVVPSQRGSVEDQKTPFIYAIREDEGCLFVRSTLEPVWGRIPEKTDYRVRIENVDYQEGDSLSITVDMAPLKRFGRKEIRITEPDDVYRFMKEKMSQVGLHVEGSHVERLSGVPARKVNRNIPVHLWRCMVSAVVKDSTAFRQGLVYGVGRKKSFGAGMILVQR